MSIRRRRSPASRWIGSLVLVALVGVTASCGPGGDDADEGTPPGESTEKHLDRLRALGYVGTTEELVDDAPPVATLDPTRCAPGTTLLSIPHLSTALLVDLDGAVVHKWSGGETRAWGDVHLEPDGSLIVVGWGRRRGQGDDELHVSKLDWEGRTLWERPLPAHHDIRRADDGRLVTLTLGLRRVEAVDPAVPLRDNRVTVLDDDGRVASELSLYDALTTGADAVKLRPVRARDLERQGVDLLHVNAVQVTPRLSDSIDVPEELRPGQFLVTLRNQDLIAAVDPIARRVTWSWGRDELSGPHDAQLLANGNVLVFDNGLARNWSRVVELDPASGEIVWEFRGSPASSFHTAICGAAQRLPNGNTLLTDSDSARVIEVTRDGEIVWEFRSPLADEDGRRALVYRAERVSPDYLVEQR